LAAARQEALRGPKKACDKARELAIRFAMGSDMEDVKQEASENGERWGDVKDESIAQWEADNWGDEAEAGFDADFKKQRERDHGKQDVAA
jgi:hypothetical protein